MDRNKFIEVFSEIGVNAFGKCDIKAEYEAQNAVLIICAGLDALNEFGGTCGSRTAYLMKIIRDKFENNDRLGKEVHDFIDSIGTMVIASNRYWLQFGAASTIIQKFQDM